jgi:hypothetical protein
VRIASWSESPEALRRTQDNTFAIDGKILRTRWRVLVEREPRMHGFVRV